MDWPTCRNHANVPAAYRCAACGEHFCDQCIKTHRTGGVEVCICPLCGGQGVSVRLEPQVPPGRPKAFLAKLPETFVYPLRGPGKYLILSGAIFFWLLGVLKAFLMALPVPYLGAIASGAIGLFVGGYLGAYVLSIVGTSARGDDEPPEWPDFSNWWDDVLRPWLLILAAVALSLLPMSLCLLAYHLGYLHSTRAAWVLGIAGAVYLPMGVLGVVLFEGPEGMSPLVVIPSIVKVGPAYLVAWLVLAACFGIESAIGGHLIAPIPIIGPLLAYIVFLYFLMAEMRVLGLIYNCYERRLDWFPET